MDEPGTRISTLALAAVVVVIVIAVVIASYAYIVYTRPCCTTASTAPSFHLANVSTTTFSANSTYSFNCPPAATCHFYFSLTINVTCTGCQFSGDYVSPFRDSNPTLVSGSGNKTYYASNFDSPLYLGWNISKESTGGTLEVKVLGLEGQTYCDEATSAPFGNLTGTFVITGLIGTESLSSTS
jgi:hypothetical protein